MNAPHPANQALTTAQRTGGQLVVDALRVHGVDSVFCVPGESYLAVLDALYDEREAIRLIVARQDGSAAYMAEAYAKASGKTGVCFVTRGPGATNASVGIHTAYQDSTPMVLFIGQVGTDFIDREAFQEIDYRRMYGQMAKWVAQIDRADRVHEYVSHAFHLATSGRPGPVVLALPEDMLITTAAASTMQRFQTIEAHPGPQEIERVRTLLQGAERPLALLGGSVWSREACADFQYFAQNAGLPVVCGFRRQDLFDNRHSNYIGEAGIALDPKLGERIQNSDLVLVVGARLGEMATRGYSLFEAPSPRQRLIHVHGGAEELGRVYQAELLINSSVRAFAKAIRDVKVDGSRWRDQLTTARAEYEAYQVPRAIPGRAQMAEIVLDLRKRLPEDAIICSGAGNFTGFVQRYFRFTGWRTQVAPTSGSMGYGTPAAVGAQVAYPHRTVVCFNGDGDYLMNGQELATAVQYELPILYIIVNNGMYGTIRMHQEREYPTRTHGTMLRNPDFVALARAYGAHGELVEETAQFVPALERAIAAGRSNKQPSVIEIRIEPDAITTTTTLSAIRSASLAKQVK
jgi:acetolactate synthase I/II/III large subunit